MPQASLEKKSAVVFGATGLVGNELLKLLLSDNSYKKVTAVIRKKMLINHEKLIQVEIKDYQELANFSDELHADAYFCCIGTTLKKAGSQEAFRKVDHDIPVMIGQLAEDLSVPSLVIISSIGANASSSNFYLRTKGEMEASVRKVYSGNLKFVRPSLLIGKREEFRFGEKTAIVFMKIFGWLFFGPLKRYKGIDAVKVASAMIKLADERSGKLVCESDELQNLVT